MLEAADFAGAWALRRSIDDHLGVSSGQLIGEARLAASGDGLTYTETGRLTLANGARLHAARQYLWRWEAGQVIVRFADGGAFHSFVPAGAAAGTAHLCGGDLYQVAYDFTGWPDWSAHWQVKGPRKDYDMRSEYRRSAAMR